MSGQPFIKSDCHQPIKLILILGGLLLFLGANQAQAQAHQPAEITWPHPQTTALYFVKNQGQLEHQVDYYLQGREKTLYFTPTGVTIALTGAESDADTCNSCSRRRVRATYPGRRVRATSAR